MTDHSVSVTMERLEDFKFRVKFSGDSPELLMDEPEPLGGGNGPNASKVLSAAIGHCLSASLLFCLRKARVEPRALSTTVTTGIERNDRGRLRVERSDVVITLGLNEDDRTRITRCTQLFEDFCIVTGSVRSGIDVRVEIRDDSGNTVYDSAAPRAEG